MNTPEDIVVEVLPTEALTAEHRSAIIAVCIAAHDELDFENLFTYIPSGGRHFLVYREGELVSHAVATTRWVQPAGHPILKTAFVDAVGTTPKYQGMGYSSAAMNRMAAEIGDYEIGCLQTGRLSFYERLGWIPWRGPLAGRGDDGLIPTPQQRGVMVLPLANTPALDLDQLLTIECQPARIWQ